MNDASIIDPRGAAAAHAPALQRARGRAAVRLGPGGLRDLAQQGSGKAMLPRVHDRPPEVVFLNTAGGVTGGDRFDWALSLDAGARATGTTQAAERGYAATPGAAPARITVTLDCGPGAALRWLPQETILFDGAALHRTTRATLAGDATLLLVEMVVLGRAAMGERLSRLDFRDRREVIRDGLPQMIEPLALDDAVLARRDEPAVLGGARALASVTLLGPGAEDALGAARAALSAQGPETGAMRAAASAWDGRCACRLMAADLAPLKRRVAALVETLDRAPVPRVWQT